MTSTSQHAALIRDQFTKQAEPFAAFRIHSQEQSLEWIREGLRLTGSERILDAGCGPGLVATYLAPYAAEVVGIDATPAMLTKAREVAANKGGRNLTFQEGVMEQLPFPDGAFDGVVTRYTLHHVLDSEAVLRELTRVCRPGGRVVVCDAAPRLECRGAYDAWELRRDPSHTSARTPEELRALGHRWLQDVTIQTFRLESDVETLLASSFPEAGGREELTRRMRADVGVDALDMGARLEGDRLFMSFPILLFSGTVPSRA